MAGVKAFATADLAYLHDGTVHLIDWKSGRPGADDQVQVALAAHSLTAREPALASHAINSTPHYLLKAREQPVEPAPDLPGFAADTISAGVKMMRSYLRDVEANAPLDIGEFPRRESTFCRSCNFAQLCPKSV